MIFTRALLGLMLCCFAVPARAQDAPVAPANLVVNGDMETGQTAPDNWKKDWVGQGEITLVRDTETVHGGKAALRVEAKDTQALVTQFMDGRAGQALKVSGFVKTAGQTKLSFGLSPRDKEWKKLGGDIQIGYLQDDAKTWVPIEKTIVLPADTAHLAVAIYVEGTGQVWVDDVQIEAVDAAK